MRSCIQIHSQPSELERASEWVRDMASSCGIPEREIFNLELVLEEALTNIMNYAFDDEADHVIQVQLAFEKDEVILRIEDSGKEFDPLKAPEPTSLTHIEEVKIGGLGIHLMKRLMDAVAYERVKGKNILTLRKEMRDDRDE